MKYGVPGANGGKKRTFAVCKCDCGNVVDVAVEHLKRGKRSCGCSTAEQKSVSSRKDLTGMTFGRLTVLEMDWSGRPTKAKCRCSCGNIVDAIAAQLPYGRTQSCGCLQRERASCVNTKEWKDIVSNYGVRFLSRNKQNDLGQWLWNCECGECGSIFVALPAKVMNGHIASCGCSKKSHREVLIDNFLLELGVSYIAQYSVPDCRYKKPLFFDFAIFDNDEFIAAIEYDGEQHFEPVELFGGESGFIKTIERDRVKNEYCSRHNINLVRLPYTLSDDEIKDKVLNIVYP